MGGREGGWVSGWVEGREEERESAKQNRKRDGRRRKKESSNMVWCRVDARDSDSPFFTQIGWRVMPERVVPADAVPWRQFDVHHTVSFN